MAVGDRVTRNFLTQSVATLGLSQLTGGKRDGTVPMVGTVVDEPGDIDVVWPNGNRTLVPAAALITLVPLSSLTNPTLAAVEGDLGKWVQITDWPFHGMKAQLQANAVQTLDKSPAAAGIITDIWGFVDSGANEVLIIWVEVQNGQAHIPVYMTEEDIALPGVDPLQKPYIIQPGRRAVGYN